MKLIALTTLLVLAHLCISVASQKTEKHKNVKKVYHKKHMEDIEAKLEQLKMMEEELEREIEEDGDDYDNDDENTIDERNANDEELNALIEDDDEAYDPCREKYCGAGRECIVTEDGEGVCKCVESCDRQEDDRRKVCSNHNETWISDCELYRQRCHCIDESKECKSLEYKHVHIDYYGTCQEVAECLPGELEDFPRRMKEWLFSIMRDMADRQVLSSHYLRLEKEAEEDERKKWSYSVVWKWCDLDGHPRDKAISRHELFPLRAPLYTLEHCIAPFLDSCDMNDDHYITLKEWISCLKIEEDNMNIEDFCEDIRN